MTRKVEPSLQDMLRWAEFLPVAIQACSKMDDLGRNCGEVFFNRVNQDMFEEALRLARDALKKLKGK